MPNARLIAVADKLAAGFPVERAMQDAGYAPSTAATGLVRHRCQRVPPRDHPVVRERLAAIDGELARLRGGGEPAASTPAAAVEAAETLHLAARSKRDAISRLWRIADDLSARPEWPAWAAAGQAIMQIARLEGWIIDRKQDVPLRIQDLSLEQKRALLASARGEAS